MPPGNRHGSTTIPSEPLAFRPGTLDLEFEEFALDGDDEFFELDRDDSRISLTEWEEDWNSLTLRGQVSIETDLVKSVFPVDERGDPPGKLVLAVDCERTHRRAGHDTEINDFGEGTETVELTVGSENHYGTFTVRPQLVRTRDGEASSTYRTMPGLALANGESVTVQIDEATEGDDRLLPAQFKSFGDSESDRFPDEAVYVVDKIDLSRPILYVNSDHESIRDAMKSGPRGYIGHVMMVYRDLIFLPALSELVLWTAQDVEEDGSAVHQWQESLLKQIGTMMYDVADGAEAGVNLYEEFDEDGSMVGLLDRTSATLQDYLEVEESMNGLVDTLR